MPDINANDGSTVTIAHYGPCNNGTEVILYTINNGGHTWPDAAFDIGVTNHDFNANSTIWNFLNQYSIPEANLSILGLSSEYCPNAQAVTLTGLPSGGSFSGTGVSGKHFQPFFCYTPVPPLQFTYSNNSGSCAYSESHSVHVQLSPTASITPSAVTICMGGSAMLTASGGMSYQWSNNDITTNINVSPSTTTSYTVTVTDANSCTASALGTVTVVANISASVTPGSSTICSGDDVILTASGGIDYTWSNNATTESITVSPISNTTYTVTVTDGGSCSATDSGVVSVNQIPNASISPTIASICSGDTVMLTASGGISFSWSNNGITANAIVSPTITTSYAVTVTDANGCAATEMRTITVNPLPVASAAANPATIMQGESTSLVASGGATYVWGNEQVTSSFTDTPAVTTTYTVTVTDTNGCNSSAQTTVTVLPTGVSELQSKPMFTIYPNPSNGIMEIVFQSEISSGTKVEIYSMSGKQVYVLKFNDQSGKQFSLSYLNLPSGIYYVRTESGQRFFNPEVGRNEVDKTHVYNEASDNYSVANKK